MLVGKKIKNSRKILLHSSWFDYKLCLIVKDAYSKRQGGADNDSVRYGSARGVMVIVAGIGHGDTSSNPGLIAFHIALIPLGKV